ncbi:MAG TPA: CheR family methyltransferase, partial [Desulfobacteria bacterium]|nr:CheR family methyltransferase [Desulfobacteria bacterium]
MKKNILESLLNEKIGLDTEAIGRKVIEKAVGRRMAQCGSSNLEAYTKTLLDSNDEWQHLIEMVVVPETWFFRNRKVFNYLGRFVKDRWLPENRGRRIKVLSIPCSTGEEPYSIAMSFTDEGIHKERFTIVGIDISEKALEIARAGFYGKGSFRGKDLAFRDRYFQPQDDGYQLSNSVIEKVRFKAGNIMEKRFVTDAPYDIIFCRNLMIYMSPEARNQTLQTMSRLLAEQGIFFCGHAERQTAIEWGFEAINESGVFACRKRCRESGGKSPSVDAAGSEINPQVPLKKIKAIPKPSLSVDDLFRKSTKEKKFSNPAISVPTFEKTVNLFQEARRMADQGQLPKALELCEVFLGENPVHAEAHFLMGLIYEALHNDEKAEAFFNRAVYLNPEHVEALNHLAFIELGRG